MEINEKKIQARYRYSTYVGLWWLYIGRWIHFVRTARNHDDVCMSYRLLFGNVRIDWRKKERSPAS
jgi:hypothetical protein